MEYLLWKWKKAEKNICYFELFTMKIIILIINCVLAI